MHGLTKVTLAALGSAGIIGGLAACAGKPKPDAGPMAEQTNFLLEVLQPGQTAGKQRLSVAKDSIRHVASPEGGLAGTYDGTRLLTAADEHAYGAPTLTDPAVDVRGDGFATFNEIRHVLRSFDADGSLAFGAEERRAFEAAVGIRWLAADD